MGNPKNSPSPEPTIEHNQQDSINHLDDVNFFDDDESPIKAQRMNLIKRISADLEQNAHLIFAHGNVHHNRHNTQNLDTVQNLSDIETPKDTPSKYQDRNNSKPPDSPLDINFFKDDHSDSSSFLSEDSLIKMTDKNGKESKHRNSKPRLSLPSGLSNIDISVE